MSYDIAVWEGPEPRSTEEADEQFAALADQFYEGRRVAPTPALRRFAKSLFKVFPDGDESVWAMEPLLENASGPVWIIPCRSGRAAALVAGFLGSLTHEHGLHCLDLQSGEWLSDTDVPSASFPPPLRAGTGVESKLLRKTLREKLRSHGFDRWATRGSRFVLWRDWDEGVDLVSVSFASPEADEDAQMTPWVSIWLGLMANWIPVQDPRQPIQQKNGLRCPDYWRCELQFLLWKRAVQARERDSPGVWFLRRDHSDLVEVVEDVCRSLDEEGLPWLDEMHDPARMLVFLLETDERWEQWVGRPKHLRGAWGIGRRPSPNRNALTGFTAARLGDTTLAREKLTAFVEWREGRPEEDRVKFRNGWDEAAEAILADLR